MTKAIATALTAALITLLSLTQALAFDTRARAAYVVDQGTGTVLLSKNADTPLPPASMSKLMTVYMAFEAVREGRLRLTEELPVSQHAMNYGGSTLFLRAGERVTVQDLLRGIIVLSGNDACAVIAEALSPDGTEAGFAQLMTRRAEQLGMTHSTFANSNGWPDPNQRMSMEDLAILANRLHTDFPEFYPMFAETEFLFDEKESQNRYNRNPLLGLGIGADGLKTGHTSEAGYGLVGSAKQGDRRIFFALTGLETAKARAEEAEAIVNWAFRQFSAKTLLQSGEPISNAQVVMGAAATVPLVPAQDVTLLLPIFADENVPAEIVYSGPIKAPIAKDQELATLVISPDGMPAVTLPLFAGKDVGKGGFFVRLRAAATTLLGNTSLAAEGAS
ncbi:MAG: D-alanyl-D-alanine carboxypeptidase [Pseudopelagicola sp.]|nr:D-alanyl-D-alanine carboxypeptidase [Pseudopelagicola sp.]